MKQGLLKSAASVLIFGLTAGSNVFAESLELCPHPRPGSVPLAFSIPNFSPGEFDRVCSDRIERAIARGFTVVTITPKIAFDRNQNESQVGEALVPGELSRCLETAWRAGLDVIYSPHVEDATPGESPIWRAKFDLHPDEAYELAGFEEFLAWMKNHVDELVIGPQKVRISIATELEDSTLKHTREWVVFTAKLRQRLEEFGISQEVALGIQPNWYPMGDPGFFDCREFGEWISSLDFISPSMYGDWSQFELGEAQVSQRVESVKSALSRNGHFWCQIPEFTSKPFGFGELGIGADLVHTERTNPLPSAELPKFIEQRRQIYVNALSWMKDQSDFTLGYPIVNIWAYGFYDLTGLDQNSAVVPDPLIVQSIEDYKSWRCGEGG